MKSILVLVSFALSALAQRATIISPVNGSTITAGSQIVVDVHQENSPTDEVQVAIVLGLNSCRGNESCDGVTPGQNGVGDILFKGVFNPQYDPSEPQIGMHQNFTVQVPEFGVQGPSILSLTHLEMIGAAKTALLETSGIVVAVE